MKKFLCYFLVLIMALAFVGCAEMFPEIVSEKPIDTEYVAAYDAMETVMRYKYDWVNFGFKYVPMLEMVHHDDVYNVQYKIVYSDGTTHTRWRTVSKEEYEKAFEQIEKGESE